MNKKASPAIGGVISYGALLGQVIQRQRVIAQRNQQDVAEALHISQSAYSRIEKGQSAMSVQQLRAIADTLGLAPDALLSEADRWAAKLRARGVQVTDEKADSKSGLLIALGVLAALWAASR
jgi:transcriptional regulator with XRE-family HTH domain